MKYINNDSYIVINCDRLLELPDNKNLEDKELIDIKKVINKKYGDLNKINNFKDVYLDIVNYVREHKKKCIIEGNVIQDIDPITSLVGTIIIKRTSVLKSYFRAIKRDYQNQYFMDLEIKRHGKLGKIYRLNNIIKRRLNIFNQAKEIENIIEELNK